MDTNNNKEHEELREVFEIMDQNRDGELCPDDVKKTMRKLGHDVPEEHINKFIRHASHSNGGPRRCSSIKQHEFIEWMQNECQAEDTTLLDAFKMLDSDQDGYLVKVELKKGLDLLGIKFSDNIFELMFEEADKDRDGKISYREFLAILQ